ncbi:MAG: nitroreductase [Spirochaetaceae bacterium]|nr:nitroreductase [Spirochaetaceae bacterium]
MTNEVLSAIFSRRSTKKYDSQGISGEELDTILEAGLWAANGKAAQSPLSVAVTDKATRDELSKMNRDILGIDTDPFYGAPCVVVVFADSSVLTAVEDGSLVIGNMLLAAESLGVGACWIHRAKQMFETDGGKALMKKWGVEDKYIGVGCCVLGYPSEGGKKPAAPRREGRIIKV